MEFLSELVSVSPQISPEDIGDLKDQGVRYIICHRPDDEEAGQVPFADIQEAAESTGIEAAFLPVRGDEFPEQAIVETKEILDKGLRTHMYCRSGTRSAIIWAAAQVKDGKDVDAVIDTAANAGYGLGQMRDFLAAQKD